MGELSFVTRHFAVENQRRKKVRSLCSTVINKHDLSEPSFPTISSDHRPTILFYWNHPPMFLSENATLRFRLRDFCFALFTDNQARLADDRVQNKETRKQAHFSHNNTFAKCWLGMTERINRARVDCVYILYEFNAYNMYVWHVARQITPTSNKRYSHSSSPMMMKNDQSACTYVCIHLHMYLCIHKTSSSSIRFEMNHRFERQRL